MDWIIQAKEVAKSQPTIVALRRLAQWHRERSEDFLNNSVSSMRQHEVEAISLETTATYLEMEMVARAGYVSGEIIAFSVGCDPKIGRYIQVQTSHGGSPEYFWCETPSK